jgi:hypothetical protein
MKTMMILGICLLSLSALANEPRERYSVTGKSEGVVASPLLEAIECSIASEDAVSQANSKCYEEGYIQATRFSFGSCSRRFYKGMSISATFYCE